MDRRQFLHDAIVSGAAALPVLGPVSAWAEERGEHEEREGDELARMAMRMFILGIGLTAISSFLILSSTGVTGFKFSGRYAAYATARATIGFLSALQQPTVDRQIKDSQFAGFVYYNNGLTVLLPLIAVLSVAGLSMVDKEKELVVNKPASKIQIANPARFNASTIAALWAVVAIAYYNAETNRLLVDFRTNKRPPS